MLGAARTFCASLGYVTMAGAITGYLATLIYLGTSPLRSYLYLSIAVAVCATATIKLRLPQSDAQRVARLACEIRSEVRRHIDNGYTKLRPPDTQTRTMRLRMSNTADGTLTLRRVDWDEYHGKVACRSLTITPDGQVTRDSDDPNWHRVSFVDQMQELLVALQSPDYKPCLEVTKARHEDR